MKRLIVLGLLAAGLAVVPVGGAQAADTLSCRGSALRVDTLLIDGEPVVANAPNDPCADASKQLLGVPAPLNTLLVADTLNASTDAGVGTGSSFASIENAAVKLGNITADVIEARASVECVAGASVLKGSSVIADLKVGGKSIVTLNAKPNTVVVNLSLGLLKVTINEQTTVDGELTVRGVHVVSKLLGVDIVLSEARADTHGSPCVPKPECSDGIDNADPEDTVADAADPGCLTSTGVYDPNDDDETDPAPPAPECSDGVDNADPEDTLADAADPGCTGPDGAYDPNDDDETDPAPKPECSDGEDNDGDEAIDADDPGCVHDGVYDPSDDDETDPTTS